MNNSDERDYAEEEYNRRTMNDQDELVQALEELTNMDNLIERVEESISEQEDELRKEYESGKNVQRIFYASYPAFNMTWLIEESHIGYDKTDPVHIKYSVPDRNGKMVFVWPDVHFTAESVTRRINLLTVTDRFYYTLVHKLANEHNDW